MFVEWQCCTADLHCIIIDMYILPTDKIELVTGFSYSFITHCAAPSQKQVNKSQTHITSQLASETIVHCTQLRYVDIT